MCGRFTQFSSRDELTRIFGFDADDAPDLFPRYNIAPTQLVAVVLLDDGQRALKPLRWGMIPSWAKDEKIGNSLINARSETVAEKPAFRAAFKKRRCLIPTTGFYEWAPTGGKKKQPLHIRLIDGRPFALAGLWERWTDAEGAVVESCTILTTTANDLMRPFHDRMPVILAPDAYATWLDPQTPLEALQALLRPYPVEGMVAVPVGSYVSNPRHEGPQCLAS
jgi:putative SOS response-associated peptidase YedK